jgi:hypothetical protein
METHTDTIKMQVMEAEKQLLSAMKSSNVEQLDGLLHDDLLFITPDGLVITKEMDLASHAAGSMVIEQIASTVDTVNIIEDTAVAIITIRTKGKMLDQPFEGTFRYVRVWKLFGRKWKVIAGSCTQA